MSRIKRELDDSDMEHQTSKQRIINRLAKEIVSLNAQLALAHIEIIKLKTQL